jgi:hypothetical protein
MENRGDEKAVVVAMERGAAWPSWLGQQLEHNPNLFCAVQQAGDDVARLPRQVQKLAKRLGTRFSVELAVSLFGTVELDADARAETALALASTLSLTGSGELVLVGARRRRTAESLLRVAQLVGARLDSRIITLRTLFLPTTAMPGLRRALPEQRARAVG